MKIFLITLSILLCLTGKMSAQNTELKILLDSGIIFVQQANYDRAIANFEKALPLAEKVDAKKDSLIAVVMHRLSIGFFYKGEHTIAESWQLKAIEKRKVIFGENHPDYAGSLAMLGNIYWAMGRYPEAEKVLLASLKVRKALSGDKNIAYAVGLLSLANLYAQNVINYDKAEKIYIESKEIVKAILGDKHPTYATIINNLGGLYFKRDNFVPALSLIKEALEIKKATLGQQHPEYVQSLSNIASIYERKGFYKESETLLLAAFELSKAKVTEKQQENYIVINNLGVIYVGIRQDKKAEEYLQKGYNIYSTIISKNNFAYSFYIREFIYFRQLQKEYVLAYKLHQEMIENMMSQLVDVYPWLNEKEKIDFNNGAITTYFDNFNSFVLQTHLEDKNNAILANLKVDLFNNQLVTKGFLLQSSQKMKQQILGSQDIGLVKLFGQWEKQRQKLLDYDKLPEIDKKNSQESIDSLAEVTNTLEKELSAKSENFATVNDKKRYSWQDIQNALQPKEAAIKIVRIKKFGVEKVLADSSDVVFFKEKGFYPKYDRYGLTDTIYYAALLISKETKDAPELIALDNGGDLENKYLIDYQTSISKQSIDENLYTQFWQRIAAAKTLSGINKVYFAPDGVYNQINLSTLYNPRTKKYLIANLDIQQVTNLKEIITNRQKVVTLTKEIVLIGYPNYELGAKERREVAEKQRQERQHQNATVALLQGNIGKVTPEMIAHDTTRAGIGNLLQTKIEVEAIAKLATENHWQPRLYTKDEALEETIKLVNSPRILHIATHGFFNVNVEQGKNANPLVRSGLLLAGAAQTLNGKEPMTAESLVAENQAEDGVLTAYEVMNLNLDKTDLVVLSACETGLGKVENGEGVYGLQRAFIAAGAKALIISLWKVSDVATNELMTLFYKDYLKSGNKRKAFLLAQKKLRKTYENPYFWGAFVMIGE